MLCATDSLFEMPDRFNKIGNCDIFNSKLTDNSISATSDDNDVFTLQLLEKGFKEERFRIDRKKLEDMLQIPPGTGCEGTNENAEDFFQRVMADTSTQISWPSKLKIGAKSKKDPHVKIIGKPDDVQSAKLMILEVLDTRQKNRVTLKMDVSHTDHSYIIGKGGFKIQQVMEETGCHIHFPDSNRNSNAEKSNQVSVAGEAEGVELARSKIRELLPLVFIFELPAGAQIFPGDETVPALQQIQQTYSFNVAFKAHVPGRILVVVRGCQRLLQRLRQGLLLLMECLTGSQVIPVMGSMKTEIAAQHHHFVMGDGGSNVHAIMAKTGATITFPDPSTPLNATTMVGAPVVQTFATVAQHLAFGTAVPGPQLLQSKTSVVIQGSFDNVCLAWQELLKCLPMVLMFDLKEKQDMDSVLINHLMETYKISIMVRPKVRENIKSVILRGAEKDSQMLFQVRKEILGMQEASINLELNNGSVAHAATATLGYNKDDVPVMKVMPNSYTGAYSSFPSVQNNDMSTAESLAALSTLIQQNPKLIGVLHTLSTILPAVNSPEAVPPQAPIQTLLNNGQPRNCSTQHYESQMKPQGVWPNTMFKSNSFYMHDFNQELPPFLPPSPTKPRSSSSSISQEDTDSGIFFTSTRRNSPSQPESSASSTSSLYNEEITRDFENMLLNSQKNKDYSGTDSAAQFAEYEKKKLSAAKAMHRDIDDGVRTPTASWSGCLFSKSMPGYMLKGKLPVHNGLDFGDVSDPKHYEQYPKTNGSEALSDQACSSAYLGSSNNHPIDQAPSPFSLSNYWEHLSPRSSTSSAAYNSVRTIGELFSVCGLEQYTDLFEQQEIDIKIFKTLTDLDLQQLNISHVARKKMLSVISVLQPQKPPSLAQEKHSLSAKLFRAAPGAERRPLFSRQARAASGEVN